MHAYMHCTALHCITLHYITLHHITLHYITLHYITLHYIHTYIHIYTWIECHIYIYLYLYILYICIYIMYVLFYIYVCVYSIPYTYVSAGPEFMLSLLSFRHPPKPPGPPERVRAQGHPGRHRSPEPHWKSCPAGSLGGWAGGWGSNKPIALQHQSSSTPEPTSSQGLT